MKKLVISLLVAGSMVGVVASFLYLGERSDLALKYGSEPRVLSSSDSHTESTSSQKDTSSTIEQEIDLLIKTCNDDYLQVIYGGGDCEISDSIIALVEQYDIEPYNPPVKGDCYEVVEELPGGKTITASKCPYLRAPTSYSVADSQSLIDSARHDPRAALEVARRSEVKKQSIGWMLHAAALSPDPQKASGPLLRAAKSFSPGFNLTNQDISMTTLVQRIAFEEMASERGNPFARPSFWWNGLNENYPDRFDRTRVAVNVLKSSLEKSLSERRADAGLPNA